MTREDDPIVSVADLDVSLGGTTVLDGVSVDVSPGSFVGLVGPNGAGKTTLLRTVGASLDPDAGTVQVAGEPIHDLASKRASRLVATVPQDTSFSFDFTVRETVEMGRTPYVPRFGRMDRADRAAVDRAMERTAVTEFADRNVTAVSGGERSRVLLARALAQDTPVLLLDEPTASLDVNHQIRTLELVRDLVDDGKTAVAAIHDLDLAARYCDELVLVGDGRVLAHGPPAEVLTAGRIGDAFDANAVVTGDPVTGTPRVTALRDPEHDPADPRLRVHVVAGGGRSGPLLARLVDAGCGVSVGAVPEGDADASVADAFDLEVVTVPPFEGVGPAARDRVAELVAAADVVVVGDVDLSAGMVPNLDAAREADAVVCVEDRPLTERAVDETATERYRALRDRGTVTDADELFDTLRAATPADRQVPADD